AFFGLLPLFFEEDGRSGHARTGAATGGRRSGSLCERASAECEDRHPNSQQSNLHESLRYGNANTKTFAALLGCNSGVIRPADPATSDEPVVTATYCLPPAANV